MKPRTPPPVAHRPRRRDDHHALPSPFEQRSVGGLRILPLLALLPVGPLGNSRTVISAIAGTPAEVGVLRPGPPVDIWSQHRKTTVCTRDPLALDSFEAPQSDRGSPSYVLAPPAGLCGMQKNLLISRFEAIERGKKSTNPLLDICQEAPYPWTILRQVFFRLTGGCQ
jgi:hypothetical protein